MQISESESIAFWAHQFSEHMQLIKKLLKRNSLNISPKLNEQLDDLVKAWNHIQQYPDSLEGDSELLEETQQIKERMKEKFEKAGLECLPDLMVHMLEELDYFKNAILDHNYHPLKELHFWAQEHAENLDFSNCQLPVLIEEDELVSEPPPEVEELAEDNAQLSHQFKALAEKIAASRGHKVSFSKLAGQLHMLKVKHLKGLNQAIKGIRDLPLSTKSQKLLHTMLHHERSEARFAFDRLQSLHY